MVVTGFFAQCRLLHVGPKIKPTLLRSVETTIMVSQLLELSAQTSPEESKFLFTTIFILH